MAASPAFSQEFVQGCKLKAGGSEQEVCSQQWIDRPQVPLYIQYLSYFHNQESPHESCDMLSSRFYVSLFVSVS